MHVSTGEQSRRRALTAEAAVAPAAVLANLVDLAAVVCETPIAVVSLIAEEEQCFQTQVGLGDMVPTSRESSFCTYAIQQADGILEIEDAQTDVRFRDNPLVVQQPNLRFYAGAPLVNVEGRVLGALCVMHHQPRCLRPEQRAALEGLARETVAKLEHHQQLRQLQQELAQAPAAALLPAANSTPRAEVFVKNGSRLERVNLTDICYVEALGDYVNIYTTTADRLTVYTSMKELQAKLPDQDFVRVQRKYIIRLDCLQAIEGDSVLVRGPKEALYIPIGNSYKTALLNRLNLI